MKEINEIISHIINLEGGYSNDEQDSGGATKYGITEATARQCGYRGKMQDLTKDQAYSIYSKVYILNPKLDKIYQIDKDLGYDLIDFGVNQGVPTAIKQLQKQLNVLNTGGTLYPDQSEDGLVGAQTLNQITQFIKHRGSQEILLKQIKCLQGSFYMGLTEKRPKDEKFLYGWLKNRV